MDILTGDTCDKAGSETLERHVTQLQCTGIHAQSYQVRPMMLSIKRINFEEN